MDKIKEEAARRLEAGADALESGELKWAQGSLESLRVGNACLMVAPNRTGHTNMEPSENEFAVIAAWSGAIHAHTKVPGATWNDQPGRTVHEVIDVLKQAAKDLRNQS